MLIVFVQWPSAPAVASPIFFLIERKLRKIWLVEKGLASPETESSSSFLTVIVPVPACWPAIEAVHWTELCAMAKGTSTCVPSTARSAMTTASRLVRNRSPSSGRESLRLRPPTGQGARERGRGGGRRGRMGGAAPTRRAPPE